MKLVLFKSLNASVECASKTVLFRVRKKRAELYFTKFLKGNEH